MSGTLTHLDAKGQARMVDVSAKTVTERVAVARGRVLMSKNTLNLILEGEMPKGDVLAVARVAGIMAAKKTGSLIPLCHPLSISAVSVDFRPDREKGILEIEARVKTTGQTGVEMEALTAVSVAALAIYDMCKAVERGMVIDNIRLVEKSGGRSGHFQREGEKPWDAS
ncbi:cyclic pyranopterin monophosphate synthase MoaC [Moorella sp. ACPs]|uniref:cyclic pyranopterin monophosphate synthase MoaC n=1 Tax=Neomoorella carbonis TaxID=3062783 RepID=UPI003248DA5B